MRSIVVDASVAAKWFFPEEHSDASIELRQARHSLRAPDFLLLEMDALFSKRMRRGEITHTEGEKARIAFRKLPITYHNSSSLASSAFEISCKTGGAFYDCLYLSLAIKQRAILASADRRFVRTIEHSDYSDAILWIADIRRKILG